MKTQKLQLWNAADLFRFHQYVRNNHVHGIVQQNQFVANVRNSIMLAFALPLDAAIMKITAENDTDLPEFEVRSLTSVK